MPREADKLSAANQATVLILQAAPTATRKRTRKKPESGQPCETSKLLLGFIFFLASKGSV